jgi:hypothetical protein
MKHLCLEIEKLEERIAPGVCNPCYSSHDNHSKDSDNNKHSNNKDEKDCENNQHSNNKHSKDSDNNKHSKDCENVKHSKDNSCHRENDCKPQPQDCHGQAYAKAK